jgi:hypothetical protein
MCRPMDEEEDLCASNRGHWRALPQWAKAITIFIGVPAWLVLMASVFRGEPDGGTSFVAFCTFGGVAVLQTLLLVRAYWRMEL